MASPLVKMARILRASASEATSHPSGTDVLGNNANPNVSSINADAVIHTGPPSAGSSTRYRWRWASSRTTAEKCPNFKCTIDGITDTHRGNAADTRLLRQRPQLHQRHPLRLRCVLLDHCLVAQPARDHQPHPLQRLRTRRNDMRRVLAQLTQREARHRVPGPRRTAQDVIPH